MDLLDIPQIPNETNYWIIRSGIESTYFDEFAMSSCIAVGWDRISDIERIGQIKDIGNVKKIVKLNYPELSAHLSPRALSRKISDISSKVDNFINELKIGDIIVTPGKDDVLIGKVSGDPYIREPFIRKKCESFEEELIGHLNKARDVHWIKRINRKDLEPNLKLILGVYHGIAHLKNEQVITEINRTLFDFYVKEDEGHSIFKVRTQDSIDFDKYTYFIKSLHHIYNIFRNDFEKNNLYIKSNVQSPGPIELIGEYGLISKIVIAANAVLKNDDTALSLLTLDDQYRIEQYKGNNPVEYDYDDYDFPFPTYGQY